MDTNCENPAYRSQIRCVLQLIDHSSSSSLIVRLASIRGSQRISASTFEAAERRLGHQAAPPNGCRHSMQHGSRFSSISIRRESRARETARGRRKSLSSTTEFLIALGVWVLIGIALSLTWTSFSGGSSGTVTPPQYHPGEEIYMRAMADLQVAPKPPVKPLNVMRIPVFQAPAFTFEFELPPLDQFVPDKAATKSSVSSSAPPARGGGVQPRLPDE